MEIPDAFTLPKSPFSLEVPKRSRAPARGRRVVRKKKARKTRLGFIEPHGSINDSHRLKFRSKEMLLGSTRHPQCSSPFSPFLSFPFHAGTCCWLLGSGTESTASPISHRPPVGQAAGDIFCEWIFPHWSRLCREEREAEHGKEQPPLLTSFFFFVGSGLDGNPWSRHRARRCRQPAEAPAQPAAEASKPFIFRKPRRVQVCCSPASDQLLYSELAAPIKKGRAEIRQKKPSEEVPAAPHCDAADPG